MKYTEEVPSSDGVSGSEMVVRHTPLVVRGAARDFLVRCAEDGSVTDWFASRLSNHEVSVTTGLSTDGGLVTYSAPNSGSYGRNVSSGLFRFQKFLDEIKATAAARSASYCFSQVNDVGETIPELSDLLSAIKVRTADLHSASWNLWIGSGGHRINTHFDSVENFYFVLQGRKIFRLFEPGQLVNMYTASYEGGKNGASESSVNSVQPDYDKYPKFHDAIQTSEVADLAPGDMLYLPANWWHSVSSEGVNISANLWWSDIDDAQKLEAEITFLRLLAHVKPLPQHWRQFWAANIDHYVFEKGGDPFSHMVPGAGGLAGAPSSERTVQLRDRISRLERELHRITLNLDVSNESLRLCCAPGLRVEFLGDEKIKASCGIIEQVLGLKCAFLLNAFSRPCSPTAAYTAAIATEFTPRDFADHLVRMIRSGLLLVDR
ncbi:cupin-like domain-containing protein (plasmid) [Ensifer sp. D2-11]